MLTRRARWRALPPACLLLASLTPIAAAAATLAANAPVTAAAAADLAAQPVELFLDARIDGERSGLLVSVIQHGATLRMTVETLRELGLDPARFGVEGRTDFALDEVPGLRYRYDAAAQTLDLNPAANLRATNVLSARNVRATGPAQASRGLLVNYNLYAQSVGGSVAGNAELRYFDRHGTLTSTGSAILRGDRRGYTRFDTSWVRPFEDRMTTLQLGDTVTPALGWTRALRLGGIEWRRNFDLRPDLVTYPVASVAGSAVVPSSVDLYVNNVRQFSAEVPTGPFVIDQVAGLNGAGQATVITRDTLGRQVATTLPLYVDTRLMARGLSDYAVSVGALRRDYGQHSFRYGGAAAIGSWRHGWRDTVTFEGHVEAGRGLGLVGAGLLAQVPRAGVVNVSLAASGGARRGWQAGLGYQYVSPRLALDLQSVRASASYGDLGAVEGTPTPRALDRASLSMSFTGGDSLSVNLIQLRVPQASIPILVANPLGLGGTLESNPAVSRTVSLAWSHSVGERGYLSVGGFQDLKRRTERGISFTFGMAFDSRISVNTAAGRQNGQRVASMSVGRTPDFEGGVGWALQAGTNGAQRYDQAQLQYLGSRGRATASTQSVGGTRVSNLDVSGALVAMDGTLVAARQVGRGFALVSVGAPDLPVLQDNRLIGRTDAGGRLLVPDLMPYAPNRIAIDPSSLPPDTRIDFVNLDVVPRQYAGVVARFALERYAAATIMVINPDGKAPEVGTPARLEGDARNVVVGYDGVVFVEGLRERNRVLVGAGKDACEVRFAYKAVAGELPTIGPLVCQPVKGESK